MLRILLCCSLLLLALTQASAQLFIGPNIGSAYGRTPEAGLLYYPKNEDWISIALGGGYTFNGPMYFPRKKAECIGHFRNQGWHIRLGLRNGLTTDHHENHLYWGLDLIYSRQHESVVRNACEDATEPLERVAQSINVWSGALNLGFTWNPLRRQTIYQKFLVDLGIRIAYPFASSAPLLGERDYISGVGFTWFPIRSIAFEPVLVLRWELFHSRYGYSKGKTKTLFK